MKPRSNAPAADDVCECGKLFSQHHAAFEQYWCALEKDGSINTSSAFTPALGKDTSIALLHPDLFKASRTGIDVASDQIIGLVKSGERNPLEVKVWVKAVEEILERVKKEIADSVLTESGKYPEKTFSVYGATLTKAEHGTKYNYAACGDTVWERLNTDVETAKARLSEREAFLKALKSPEVIADQMTGEMVTISPPVKTSVSGLNVSIK